MDRGDDGSREEEVPTRPPRADREGDARTSVSPVPTGPPDVDSAVELLLEEIVEDPEASPLLSARSLRGRCAIVTGGAIGVGRAVALEFARHGVHVAFTYFDDGSGTQSEEATRTAREITQLEVRVHHEEVDVRDAGAVDEFVRRATEKLGGLHALVNTAEAAADRAIWRLTDEHWNTVIDTNLTGAFHFIRAVTAHFRAQAFGKIVNVSSTHALRTEFGLANFSASKAGLLALTRSAALELGPSNVNVNAVAPGNIRTTHATAGVPADVIDRARETSALGRFGDPRDVANVALFLCSDLARHITGAVIPVDGGHSL